MNSGIDNSTQTHDSFTETVELKHRQVPEMDSLDNGFPPLRLPIAQWVNKSNRPLSRFSDELRNLCALLASQNELETAENIGATCSRRDNRYCKVHNANHFIKTFLNFIRFIFSL